MKKKDLDEILNYDPLAEAEKLTGKSYKEDKRTMSLGFIEHIRHTADKRKTLHNLDDTSYSEDIERWTRITKDLGFEEVLHAPFEGTKYREDQDAPKEYLSICWHPCGILMKWDTYRGNRNSASIYFNWTANDQSKPWGPDLPISGGMVNPPEGKEDICTLCAHIDIREAFRHTMKKLFHYGKFETPWIEQPHLWLLHHEDEQKIEKDSGGDWKVSSEMYKNVNLERISQLPEHVRNVICPNMKENVNE
jgi:hypothetical protein